MAITLHLSLYTETFTLFSYVFYIQKTHTKTLPTCLSFKDIVPMWNVQGFPQDVHFKHHLNFPFWPQICHVDILVSVNKVPRDLRWENPNKSLDSLYNEYRVREKVSLLCVNSVHVLPCRLRPLIGV